MAKRKATVEKSGVDFSSIKNADVYSYLSTKTFILEAPKILELKNNIAKLLKVTDEKNILDNLVFNTSRCKSDKNLMVIFVATITNEPKFLDHLVGAKSISSTHQSMIASKFGLQPLVNMGVDVKLSYLTWRFLLKKDFEANGKVLINHIERLDQTSARQILLEFPLLINLATPEIVEKSKLSKKQFLQVVGTVLKNKENKYDGVELTISKELEEDLKNGVFLDVLARKETTSIHVSENLKRLKENVEENTN